MVGGIVIEVIELPDKIWVNCRDRTYATDTCAVFVEKTDKARSISAGDKFWWQAGTCYWTPWPQKTEPTRHGIDYEIPIRKIGFSHMSRPQMVSGSEVLTHA